jgi:hypothetical protein
MDYGWIRCLLNQLWSETAAAWFAAAASVIAAVYARRVALQAQRETAAGAARSARHFARRFRGALAKLVDACQIQNQQMFDSSGAALTEAVVAGRSVPTHLLPPAAAEAVLQLCELAAETDALVSAVGKISNWPHWENTLNDRADKVSSGEKQLG